MPRLMQFATEMQGVPLQDSWDDIPPALGKEDSGYATQKPLARLTVSEARRLSQAGQFPAGSMGPKIEAAVNFVTSLPRARAVITSCDRMVGALDDGRGTWIVRDSG